MKNVLLSGVVLLVGSMVFASDPINVVKDGDPFKYSPLLNANVSQMTSVLESQTRQIGISPIALLENSAITHNAKVLSTDTEQNISLPQSTHHSVYPISPPVQGLNPVRGTLIPITSCQDITTPGHYVLVNDIVGTSSCLSIHDTANVTLSCNGHQISDHANALVDAAVNVANTSNFTMDNCSLQSSFDLYDNSGSSPLPSLMISNSQQVTVTHSHIAIANLTSVTGGVFANNDVTGYYLQSGTSYMSVRNNTVLAPSDRVTPGAMESTNGSNNQFLGNHINGGWDGTNETIAKGGADDGINLSDESEDLVKDNLIEDDWDAGIETSGVFNNNVITGNTILNSGSAAIGAYFRTSWIGDTINNNTVENAPDFFSTEYVWPTAGYPVLQPQIYFENNVISNNIFRHSVVGAGIIPFAGIIDFGNLPSAGGGPHQLIANNNLIKNNDFGQDTNGLLIIAPPGAFIDGGDNICAPSPQSPMTCVPS